MLPGTRRVLWKYRYPACTPVSLFLYGCPGGVGKFEGGGPQGRIHFATLRAGMSRNWMGQPNRAEAESSLCVKGLPDAAGQAGIGRKWPHQISRPVP